jgi:uncharacterized protein (TIGR03437 family)
VFLAVPGGQGAAKAANSNTRAPIPSTQILRAYDNLALSFEANHGQADAAVKFIARGNGYTLYLRHSGDLLTRIQRARSSHDDGIEMPLEMKVVGANPQPHGEGLEQLPAKVNYFIGNDPSKWRTGIPTFARVKYRQLYDGIDLVYYGKQGRLEYDFEIAPGAGPEAIRLQFEGADQLQLDHQGRLQVRIRDIRIHFEKPTLYQQVGQVRRTVAGGYELKSNHRVGFRVGPYDKRRPLVIDPVLVYSTYLGGNHDDEGLAIAVDSAGSAVVTGTTASVDFPTTVTPPAAPFRSFDVFVTKFNPAGSALMYSTYIGGDRGTDVGRGIALDPSGNAYITGETNSANFPTTPGAFQSTNRAPLGTAFVAKLSSTGALVYSTYLGGGRQDSAHGVAVDGSGSAYVTGATGSTDFPVTPGAFQARAPADFIQNSAFATKLNAGGTGLVYSTYLGGTFTEEGHGIAVDSAGNAYITGEVSSSDFPTTAGTLQRQNKGAGDAFVTKLNSAGSAPVYSTFLGGGNREWARSIVVDGEGNAYVSGATFSRDFPVTAGAFQTAHRGGLLFLDAFVAKLNPAGSALGYSTFLGATGDDEVLSLAVDSSGNAHLAGVTYSTDFPVTPDAFQSRLASPLLPNGSQGASPDAFIAKLNGSGAAVVFASYFGGNTLDTRVGFRRGVAVAVDPAGNAYLCGTTLSLDFPTAAPLQRNSAGTWDAFVAKIGDAGGLAAPVISSVVNAASFQPGLASGAWLTVFGTNLAATTRTWRDTDFVGGRLPTQLDSVAVNVNAKPAYVYYISPTQINVLAPGDETEGQVPVEVVTPRGRSNALTVEKRPVAPALFKFDAEGRKYLAVVHADGTLLGKLGLLGPAPVRPAKPGDVIMIFGTGFGPTNPPAPEGEIITDSRPLATPVTVRIGNVSAAVGFGGIAGAGLYQFNVTVPGLPNGDHAVVAEIGLFRSQPDAFITVQAP